VYDPSLPGLLGDGNALDKIESAVAAYPAFRLVTVPMDKSFAGAEYEGLSFLLA
jgi:hypothetical protein